jgi:hypothetical protein
MQGSAHMPMEGSKIVIFRNNSQLQSRGRLWGYCTHLGRAKAEAKGSLFQGSNRGLGIAQVRSQQDGQAWQTQGERQAENHSKARPG